MLLSLVVQLQVFALRSLNRNIVKHKCFVVANDAMVPHHPSIITEGEPVGPLAVEEYFFLLLAFLGRHMK